MVMIYTAANSDRYSLLMDIAWNSKWFDATTADKPPKKTQTVALLPLSCIISHVWRICEFLFSISSSIQFTDKRLKYFGVDRG